ncbi:uncharacterized protein SAPINGB_P002241 [Magnusiomyces paraingens]|uniref:Protein phosphatase n=1 Tax=Magnusiomyces paraingens TaxID=2606893 RepID=A0A5E8BKU4_9ASCO|nr:uncharacterized protein SAPINGB_P002241 [Saprochaete ingens]VVT49378.1 unnamed protein product [Saprochaete ingens]
MIRIVLRPCSQKQAFLRSLRPQLVRRLSTSHPTFINNNGHPPLPPLVPPHAHLLPPDPTAAVSQDLSQQHSSSLDRDLFLREQELHKLHSETLLPPIADPFDLSIHNQPQPDPFSAAEAAATAAAISSSPIHQPFTPSYEPVDHNTKLLDDSYNYDAMPFEELLEQFEQEPSPFQETHSSSSLGHTIVIQQQPAQEHSSPCLTPNRLFNHSCGLELSYAIGGYAYHTSKNPSRKTLMESLPDYLLSPLTGNYALLDNKTPISLGRGDHSCPESELQHLASINDVPVEAYDKVEVAGVTSLGCGEDSVVGSSQILALADGVSGWNLKTGGHAALWSRLILHKTLTHFVQLFNSTAPDLLAEKGAAPTPGSKLQSSNELHVSKALNQAFYETKDLLAAQQESGSSTIILAAMDTVDKELHIVHIGDSCIWIFRDRQVLYTVDHGLKTGCPKQLGTNSKAPPSEIDEPTTLRVQPDDIILMCSDGLSDNLFIGEITETLFKGFDRGGLQAAADDLIHLATDRSFDNFAVCPYQLNASPFSTGGGKSDDISVLVAQVVPTTV